VSIHRPKSYRFPVALISMLLSSAIAYAAGAPTRISIASGKGQTGKVGTALANPWVVLVTDSSGNPVDGATVNWQVTAGGASFPATKTTTNSSGLASNTLTLGTVTGFDKATALLANGAAAIFGASATPGAAVSISSYSGNDQTGTVADALPQALEVICRDKYGNPANQTVVDWTVTGGGGSVPYAHSESENGIATKALTLGAKPGANYAAATISGTDKSYTFTEEGVAGPVAAIEIVSGNDQTGSANTALPGPLTIAAVDAHGNYKSDTQVSWTANTAGDSLSATSTVTNSSGLASDTLILGSTSLLHTVTVAVQGTSISQTFTALMSVNGVVSVQGERVSTTGFQPYFLGLSYMKIVVSAPLFNENNAGLVTLFKNLGPGVLRLNGEEAVGAQTVWDPTGPGLKYGTLAKADLVRLEKFLESVDWKVLYGLNFSQNTASNAAAEAGVAAQVFGDNLLGFEIGNEPDNYSRAVYGSPPVPQIPGYTWDDFISTSPVYSSDGALLPSWPIFATAIQAAAPDAGLTGPAAGFDWFSSFAESDQASRISLLTRHIYQGQSTSKLTMETLLTPDPRFAVQFPEMEQAAITAGVPGGYRISECNTYSTPTDGVTNAFGAALWTIDFLFTNAKYQSTGVDFMGGGDKVNFSPIFDNGVNVVGIGPDYYGLFAYSLLGQGGKLMTTQVTPAPSTFSAYAVQETNGTTDLILSNKDPNNDFTVGISRPGSISQATALLMTAPSLTATSGFSLGGSQIGIDGSWQASTTDDLSILDGSAVVTVPAGSAQIVHLK